MYSVNENLLCLDTASITRGHSFKLEKCRFRLSVRQNFFSNRIVDKWSRLPENVVNAPSVQAFKNQLDDHLASEMYCVT